VLASGSHRACCGTRRTFVPTKRHRPENGGRSAAALRRGACARAAFRRSTCTRAAFHRHACARAALRRRARLCQRRRRFAHGARGDGVGRLPGREDGRFADAGNGPDCIWWLQGLQAVPQIAARAVGRCAGCGAGSGRALGKGWAAATCRRRLRAGPASRRTGARLSERTALGDSECARRRRAAGGAATVGQPTAASRLAARPPLRQQLGGAAAELVAAACRPARGVLASGNARGCRRPWGDLAQHAAAGHAPRRAGSRVRVAAPRAITASLGGAG
jgi:hypothetical protein